MSAKSQRLARIEGEMQRVLSTLVTREVRDPRVGNVTVTAVNVAPDLSSARVFFVPFGGQHAPGEVSAGLNRAAGFLRGEVRPAHLTARASTVPPDSCAVRWAGRSPCDMRPSSNSSTTSRSKTPTSSRASSMAP